MKRFFLAFIAIFLIVLSAILYDVSSAKAASPYDTIVNDYQIDTLELTDTSTQSTRNYSLDWYNEGLLALEIRCNNNGGQWCTDYQDFNDFLQNDNSSWTVVKTSEDSYQVQFTTDPNATLEFGDGYLYIQANNAKTANFYYNKTYNSTTENGTSAQSTIQNYGDAFAYGTRYLFLSTALVNYPPGYEGETIRDSHTPPEQVTLTPEYQYSVNSNGLLSVTYLKNITPFLSGTNYFVLNRTTDNWETLGAQIFSESFTPAGWTDKTFEQLLDPGYYVLRISHSQTFDSNSPWSDKDVWVHDVYIQFFWDGETTFTGTTTGCEGQVCNIFQTDESEKMWNMFEKLGLGQDEFGLGAAVTAPLTFIASLPSKAANCTPIALTLPYVNSQITLPCMSSIYQTHFGLIFSLFQTIMLGLFGYYAAVKVYGNIKQMKDPEDDRIEVVKL